MDLTKLMKGPAEAEPVQEQPKLSREEYAAQKKAEREELWTRIDALTVDAFKDGSSLRGFLDFTAQCSPERIENLLLFHSDAPEATWLKTFDEWKQAGRSVRGGEAGYTALIGQDYTREDGGQRVLCGQKVRREPDPRPAAGQGSGLCSGRAGDGGVHEQPGTACCERSGAGGDTGAVCSPKPYHLCAQQYGRADHVPCHCAGTGGGQL